MVRNNQESRRTYWAVGPFARLPAPLTYLLDPPSSLTHSRAGGRENDSILDGQVVFNHSDMCYDSFTAEGSVPAGATEPAKEPKTKKEKKPKAEKGGAGDGGGGGEEEKPVDVSRLDMRIGKIVEVKTGWRRHGKGGGKRNGQRYFFPL